MKTEKLKWVVASKPTGRYLSFENRNWPSASVNDRTAFWVFSPTGVDYDINTVTPLKVRVAVWRANENATGFTFDWKVLKGEFQTLDAAKAHAQKAFESGLNNFGVVA
jgi:hypothetical protein